MLPQDRYIANHCCWLLAHLFKYECSAWTHTNTHKHTMQCDQTDIGDIIIFMYYENTIQLTLYDQFISDH